MLTNYYTFQALVYEWRPDLIGALVSDVYSQVRGELTVACSAGNRDWSLRFSVQAPQHYVMRSEGFHRARRNVADLFPHAKNRSVEDIVLADRDRILFVKLEGGVRIQVNMYGPQANIFLAGADGRIIEAFQNNDEWAGKPETEIQPALKVDSFCQFRQRWKADYQTNVKALSSAIPLFDRLLATEALFRAGVDVKAEPD